MLRRVDEIPVWKHCGTTGEDSDFEIRGFKVWQHEWEAMRHSVYRIRDTENFIEFRAKEVSPNVWSFWVRNLPG